MKAGSVLGFAAVWRYDFRYSFLVCEMGLTIELQFPCTVPSYFHLIMLNSFFLSHTGEKYPEWGSKELLRFRVEKAVKSNLQTMEISGNWLQNTVDFSGFGIKENRLTAQSLFSRAMFLDRSSLSDSSRLYLSDRPMLKALHTSRVSRSISGKEFSLCLPTASSRHQGGCSGLPLRLSRKHLAPDHGCRSPRRKETSLCGKG